MNKKLKNKIVSLFAVLSVCSPKSSEAVDNKKLIKTIGISSVLFVGGVAFGIGVTRGVIELVKYLKNKKTLDNNNNNDDIDNKDNNYIEDPGILKDEQEIEGAKKLMDDALKQEWDVFVDSELYCKHFGHGLELGKVFAKGEGFVQQFGNAVSPDLKKFADCHLNKLREYWSKDRKKFSVSKCKGMMDDREDLVFNFEPIKVRMAIAKKDKRTIDLEFFWGMDGNWCCHFCYKPKTITDN